MTTRIIGAVIYGTEQEKYKIVIGDYSKNYKECEVIYIKNCKNIKDMKINLKEISKKVLIKSFILKYCQYSKIRFVEEGFNYERDINFIIEELKELKNKYKKLEI